MTPLPATVRDLCKDQTWTLLDLLKADHQAALELARVMAKADDGDVEHGLCDQLLAELARGKPESQTWKARAKVVLELLDHHIEEEHSEMFPLIGTHFSPEQRKSMGQRFTAQKNEPAMA